MEDNIPSKYLLPSWAWYSRIMKYTWNIDCLYQHTCIGHSGQECNKPGIAKMLVLFLCYLRLLFLEFIFYFCSLLKSSFYSI